MRGHRLSEGSESARVTRLSCCTVTRTVDRVAQSGESILQTSHRETFFIYFILIRTGGFFQHGECFHGRPAQSGVMKSNGEITTILIK